MTGWLDIKDGTETDETFGIFSGGTPKGEALDRR